MCGRTACYLAAEEIAARCRYKDDSGKIAEVSWVPDKLQTVKYVPSYNVGPRDTLVCLVAGTRFNHPSDRVLCPMMWGMIPRWHKIIEKEESMRHTSCTHNARVETLMESKLYGQPLRQGKRCVIVVNGFYEWTTVRGRKNGFYIHKRPTQDKDDNKLLFLAGLYDDWTSIEGETVYSCTVLTTEAKKCWVHERVPMVLKTDLEIKSWLNYKHLTPAEAIQGLDFTRSTLDHLAFYPVGPEVNNVKNKSKICIENIDDETTVKRKSEKNLMSSWLTTGSMKNKKK